MWFSKKEIKSSFLWSAIDSLGSQILNLAVSIVLAYKLGPSAYGMVAMLTIFIAISNVFVNSGFSNALIQKDDRDERDYSTTFYFSITTSIIAYILLYLSSSYIADFYEQPELTILTQVIAVSIIFDSLAIIPRTKLSIELNFKLQAKANLIALSLSSILALAMAFNGLGVWALVAQQLTRSILNMVALNLMVLWIPREPFCKKAFDKLFAFGSKLLISNLLDTIYNNIYGIIIGKQFSSLQLGIYNQAYLLSSTPAITITGIIQKVTFPLLSNIQNDVKKLDDAYLVILQVSASIIFPISIGIGIVSEPFVYLFLGNEWRDSAFLISVLCLGMSLYPIHAINLNMLQVKGRSDLFLKLEVIKKLNTSMTLLVTVQIGIEAICIGIVLNSFVSLIFNTYYTSKVSNISQIKQLYSLLPILIITLLAAFLGYYLGQKMTSEITTIVVTLIFASGCYVGLLIIFQKPLLLRIKSMLTIG